MENINDNDRQPTDYIPKRRKEDAAAGMRRKEDQLRYQTIDKLLGLFKYFVGLIANLLYIIYSMVTEFNKTSDYELKLLNDVHQMLVPNEDKQVLKNAKAFAVSPSTSQCKTCHGSTGNTMYIKKNWKIEDFKLYVRGVKRDNPTSIMPKLSEDSVSDNDLEKMYFILKNFESE